MKHFTFLSEKKTKKEKNILYTQCKLYSLFLHPTECGIIIKKTCLFRCPRGSFLFFLLILSKVCFLLHIRVIFQCCIKVHMKPCQRSRMIPIATVQCIENNRICIARGFANVSYIDLDVFLQDEICYYLSWFYVK